MFLVIEGLDGSGKGAQIELLKRKFPNAALFKYPTGNTPELNAYLERKIEIDAKRLFHLFLKDIMAEQREVRKAMKSSGLVILDRYVFSTIAYEKEDINYNEAKKIVASMGFLVPDSVVLIDIPANLSQERKRKQKQLDRYEENAAYLESVRHRFLALYKENFLCPNWYLIDGRKSIDEIHKEILAIIKIKNL